MAFEEKPNTFALFRNKRKEKDTHPDLTGRGNFNGVKFELSGWKRQSGELVLTGTIKEPYQKPQQADDLGDNW